jgi:hypothetical protein
MEITKKQDLPDFCQVGCKVGLVLYKPFTSYPKAKICEIKAIKILKTKIVFTFTNDETFEASVYYDEKVEQFSNKKLVTSKLMPVTDDLIARINLQNTYGKLMLKIKKMNENKVGLDGTGFQELNLKNGDIELKNKCADILTNIQEQLDKLSELLDIE